MEEIKIKDNNSGLKVQVNGLPNLLQMPNDLLDLIATNISVQIQEYKKKKRRKNNLSS